MADLVLFGAGQIAEVAKAYIDEYSGDRVVGFTVDAAFHRDESFAGLPLVAWERLEEVFPPSAVQLLGPLSYRALNELRRDRHAEGKARGYAFGSFIHPSSLVHRASIGENAFILEANVIQPFVRIGQGVMMWAGNHFGHHVVVEDYCFFASHVLLGSGARIGERCFVSGGVSVVPGVSVGAASLLSVGAMVKEDVPPESLVRGPKGDAVVQAGAERLKRFL